METILKTDSRPHGLDRRSEGKAKEQRMKPIRGIESGESM